jgi:hypothetical protein
LDDHLFGRAAERVVNDRDPGIGKAEAGCDLGREPFELRGRHDDGGLPSLLKLN